MFFAWPGGILERSRLAEAELRSELIAEVEGRAAAARPQAPVPDLDIVAFTRARVEPMVGGLFPREEQDAVLSVLERSVVVLTPVNIADVIRDGDWLHTTWHLANLYLNCKILCNRIGDDDGARCGRTGDDAGPLPDAGWDVDRDSSRGSVSASRRTIESVRVLPSIDVLPTMDNSLFLATSCVNGAGQTDRHQTRLNARTFDSACSFARMPATCLPHTSNATRFSLS
jgi:hypothetical protein